MTNTLVVIGLIGLGLIFGSFINAFVWRFHEGRDWVSERSECPHCHHVLAAQDLVPVLSYVLLKGKCRYCKKSIPDKPWPEIVLPILFVGSYLLWPLNFDKAGVVTMAFWLVFLVAFVALTMYDLKWYLLPNKIVYPLVGLAALQVIVVAVLSGSAWHDIMMAIAGALTLSGIFFLLFWISDGAWIGGGDVKLAIVLGLLAGTPLRAVLVLFLASLVGTLASIPVILRNKTMRHLKVPFGPFLIAGIILVQLFASAILSWYGGFYGI